MESNHVNHRMKVARTPVLPSAILYYHTVSNKKIRSATSGGPECIGTRFSDCFTLVDLKGGEPEAAFLPFRRANLDDLRAVGVFFDHLDGDEGERRVATELFIVEGLLLRLLIARFDDLLGEIVGSADGEQDRAVLLAESHEALLEVFRHLGVGLLCGEKDGEREGDEACPRHDASYRVDSHLQLLELRLQFGFHCIVVVAAFATAYTLEFPYPSVHVPYGLVADGTEKIWCL